MADLTLKNCVKAKDFIKNLSDEKQRTYFEFYLNQNSILQEHLIINLNPDKKNQNETLSTGHLIISLDVLGRLLMDFNKQYEKGHLQ